MALRLADLQNDFTFKGIKLLWCLKNSFQAPNCYNQHYQTSPYVTTRKKYYNVVIFFLIFFFNNVVLWQDKKKKHYMCLVEACSLVLKLYMIWAGKHNNCTSHESIKTLCVLQKLGHDIFRYICNCHYKNQLTRLIISICLINRYQSI